MRSSCRMRILPAPPKIWWRASLWSCSSYPSPALRQTRMLAPLVKSLVMKNDCVCAVLRSLRRFLPVVTLVFATPVMLHGQTTATVPDWALPGSATHEQVPPPSDFHRPSRVLPTPIGIFDGQADVGGALVPGSASYDPATKQYTVTSAGYNIWYQRDEFRFLWKKMSGDVFLAADASFPNPKGYDDRKVVLIIRQNLDDDSKEAMLGEHGSGM